MDTCSLLAQVVPAQKLALCCFLATGSFFASPRAQCQGSSRNDLAGYCGLLLLLQPSVPASPRGCTEKEAGSICLWNIHFAKPGVEVHCKEQTWGSSLWNSFENPSTPWNIYKIRTHLVCPSMNDPIDCPICISRQLFPLLPLCCFVALGFACCSLDLPPKDAGRVTFWQQHHLAGCTHLLGKAASPQEGQVVVASLAWRRWIFSSPSWICWVTWGMSPNRLWKLCLGVVYDYGSLWQAGVCFNTILLLFTLSKVSMQGIWIVPSSTWGICGLEGKCECRVIEISTGKDMRGEWQIHPFLPETRRAVSYWYYVH